MYIAFFSIICTTSHGILTKSQWGLIEIYLKDPCLSCEMRTSIQHTIFKHHLPLAKNKCHEFMKLHKYKTSYVNKEDLQFHSIAGLYHATRNYNGRSNFVKYATIYMNGALYNGLTKHYPISKISPKKRRTHKGPSTYRTFDSVQSTKMNLYLGNNHYTLRSNLEAFTFPEEYIRIWSAVHKMDPLLRTLIHQKFDFTLNVIQSNKQLSIIHNCSEETIRKKIKNAIMNLTSEYTIYS